MIRLHSLSVLKKHELYQTSLIFVCIKCIYHLHMAGQTNTAATANKFATELKVFVQAEKIIGQSRAKYLPLQSRVFVREVELDLRGTSNLITHCLHLQIKRTFLASRRHLEHILRRYIYVEKCSQNQKSMKK